jgi:hypothetical protein
MWGSRVLCFMAFEGVVGERKMVARVQLYHGKKRVK